ncbi:hypothetical protein OAI34_04220 [Emcibacteraceae bacterium]|nr:hypothetical protein [Emcibacteraceae bacterium]
MKNLIKYLSLFIITLVMSSTTARADYQKGLDAYNAGDYATAMKEWRPLAEQGVARAQANLGFMYENGRGVPEDDVEAVKWYRLAADQGVANSLVGQGANIFITRDKPANGQKLPFVASGHPLTDPLLLIICYYQFIEKLARARGLNPDMPPHLKKITETV